MARDRVRLPKVEVPVIPELEAFDPYEAGKYHSRNRPDYTRPARDNLMQSRPILGDEYPVDRGDMQAGVSFSQPMAGQTFSDAAPVGRRMEDPPRGRDKPDRAD